MSRISFKEKRQGDNSFTEFRSHLLRKKSTTPSYNNLYGIQFGAPRILVEKYDQRLVPGGRTSDALQFMLSAMAAEVSTPSRNLTTATVNNIGSAYKYATGQTHSELAITFLLPRSTRSYVFFERWMNLITNDAEQYADYFDYYTTDLNIFKFERGGGEKKTVNQRDLMPEQRARLQAQGQGNRTGSYQENTITGCWAIKQIYPYNLGQIQLTNGPAGLSQFTVQFQYSRFRYFVNPQHVQLANWEESNKDPIQNFLNSLNQKATEWSRDILGGGEYAEFFKNTNFDLNSLSTPRFDVQQSYTPPGTVGLHNGSLGANDLAGTMSGVA